MQVDSTKSPDFPSMTGTSFCFSSIQPHSPTWIVDTEATDHMVHSKSYLSHVVSTVSNGVKLHNGNFVVVTHIGNLKFSATLTLTNVLCIPSFNSNLLFISQLTRDNGCCIMFTSGMCYI